jgi:23S rRNA (cytidine2498-2'-O)-methyltransferase
MNPRFYFSVCQVGAEKAVKTEVLLEFSQLRFAFSRPGFVTFKEEDDSSDELILKNGIFTRLWGVVLGQTKELSALKDLFALIPKNAIVQAFDRDRYIPGDEPPEYTRNGNIKAVLAAESFKVSEAQPQPGNAVYSLIWIDDFHVFLGRHTHAENLSTSPGNNPDLPLPEESPSRAWLKIEEAFYRFKPVISKGQTALEVGCAPGGASTAMLNRGLIVTGIDPQNMDPGVLANANFTSIKKFARYVTENDLRSCNPDILVMDMSIPPVDALAELAHVISVLRTLYGKELKIRQGFFTIKLNDWKLASGIPQYLKRLSHIGFHDLHPVQLCSNRQEFFVWAERFAQVKQA